MGQKINPNGFRFGITKKHNVSWYAPRDKFVKTLLEDQKIRAFFEMQVRKLGIGNLVINRTQLGDLSVIIHTVKPGVVLGQNGSNIHVLSKKIKQLLKKRKLSLNIEVVQIEKPELNARLVAEDIAIKLENRGSFRAAQKFAIRSAFKAGAKGIKTSVAGRLNGVDMARTEGYTEGEMKLHTLRQDIDYAFAKANTTYGTIGVKVWISKGEILEKGKSNYVAT